jgi:hypothetical protein
MKPSVLKEAARPVIILFLLGGYGCGETEPSWQALRATAADRMPNNQPLPSPGGCNRMRSLLGRSLST